MALEPKQHAIPTLPCPGCGQRINVACTREQADEMSSPRRRDIKVSYIPLIYISTSIGEHEVFYHDMVWLCLIDVSF